MTKRETKRNRSMRLLRLLVVGLAVALTHGAFAQRVSQETARSVAETFFNLNVRNGKGQAVQFEDITAETPFQNFYIFSADSGFVLVAADERVTPILGYSKTNRFVTENMPENLRWWLEGYEGQIQAIQDNAVPATVEIATKWSCLKAGEAEPVKGNRSVELPLTTKWNQNAPYNNSCPITSGGTKCVTGCVATAIAQVLKYWNYPNQGVGNKTLDASQINETVKHPECYPLYVDFAATTYDWQNMDSVLTSSSPQEQIDAVATLMKHCGVAMNMNYGVPSEGGSTARYIMNSLVEYFDYSVAGHYEYSINYQDEEWKDLLKREIDAHRPIAYRGQSDGGHAFVFYGYDNSSRFLVNWGWGGFQDTYFAIGALNPEHGGIGGGNYDYNALNAALLHVMPNDRTLNPPASLTVNNTTGNGLQLEWSSAQYAGSYVILRNGKFLAETTMTNYLDVGVYGGSYTYQVITVGENHRASLPSGSVTYTKPNESPAPTGLTVSASEASVELSWDEPTNTVLSFSHHKSPYDDTELEWVGGKQFDNVCYEVFRPSEMAQYSNRYITSIGYRISTRMVGTLHNIEVYKGTFPNAPMVSSHQYFPNASGIYYYYLPNPIKIENDKDIVIAIKVLENIQDPFDCVGGGADLPASYLSNLEPLDDGKHFIVDLYAKWADNLTYNVYRNDGHHLVCIARDLQQPNYTDANAPAGVYTYYVTTNYFGGESEPSEMVSVGYGNFTIVANSSPLVGGTVSGGGTFPAGSVVTVSAHANAGYRFNGWMENGEIVATANHYTFYAHANRNLTATFASTNYAIGSLVTNPDGSQGVVFHVNPEGTEGWMVALNDASEGCSWGPTTDIINLNNVPFNSPVALSDLSGYRNTGILRETLDPESQYAASLVDYENGWYLPSVGQLRKLYAALPFIEPAITAAGGTLMEEGTYWSSTEFSASDASTPMFSMGNTNKGATCRVRAIRNFVTAGSNSVIVASNDNIMGTATVSGNGSYAYGGSVTATAFPNAGFVFDHWSEDGVVVSYNANYQFTFTHCRSLVAHFAVSGSVGCIVNNADGSRGVVFWLSPDGSEGLMVALEDASEGCQWGEANDLMTVLNTPFNGLMTLKDKSGNTNTRGILKAQGGSTGYAADVVGFENGWYLPSAGELRKLYGALPLIEPALVNAGGTVLTEDTYWSSTEYSGSDAATATFSMGNTNKTNTCRVRAIRHFAAAGPNAVLAKLNVASRGTVTGSGEYQTGQSVTVNAMANAGYVFDSWTENGMVVSYDAIYTFPFTRSRALVANFVSPGSVGSTITYDDGSRGVVFYADPSGIGGWTVAVEDDSEGCVWATAGEDVLAIDNQNPDQSIELLSDLDGIRNSRVLRGWFFNAPAYAASQVDHAHNWFLPSVGQLRKLYAALPFIEPAILNAGGEMMTEDAYWSSTERNENEAWTPSFAFGSSNKGSNRRVRAIRNFVTPAAQNSHIFVGTNGTSWSDQGNWINPSRNLMSSNDDVIIATQCVVDADATVKSLTMAYGSTISVDEGKRLAVNERISNTYATRINLGEGAQLVNTTEGTYFTLQKTIEGYGDSEDGGWYTIATPMKNGMGLGQLATGAYDLYTYHEPTHYWLNQKLNDNGITMLQNGSGYLYASQGTRTLTFDGQAHASNVEINTEVSNSASAGRLRGFNLIGNPFTNNIAINSLKLNGTTLSAYYKVSNGNALMAYTDADDEPIRPAEGFFVQGAAGIVSFNATSRNATVNGYVRLLLFEADKMLDRAYLKTTEGEGLPKMRLNGAKAELYFSAHGNDFAITESKDGMMEYPLSFTTKRDGTFTLVSDLLNTPCDYLHLIDNMTGADVDLLQEPSYCFEARTKDYASRFRLVFSANDADGNDASDGSATFAYYNGSQWVVGNTGKAVLQVIDAMGRVLSTETIDGNMEIDLNQPAGLYMLRLVNGETVKVQKVVVR